MVACWVSDMVNFLAGNSPGTLVPGKPVTWRVSCAEWTRGHQRAETRMEFHDRISALATGACHEKTPNGNGNPMRTLRKKRQAPSQHSGAVVPMLVGSLLGGPSLEQLHLRRDEHGLEEASILPSYAQDGSGMDRHDFKTSSSDHWSLSKKSKYRTMWLSTSHYLGHCEELTPSPVSICLVQWPLLERLFGVRRCDPIERTYFSKALHFPASPRYTNN